MDEKEFDIDEIIPYFRIDERITGVKDRIDRLRESFYEQTLTSHVGYTGFEIVTVPFRIETNVIPYVDTLLIMEQSIEISLKRKRYLLDYLNSLDPVDRDYLIEKYSKKHIPITLQQADLDLYEEILEINDAINFMYGFPVENRINNSNLEEDFNNILALLEV